MAAGRPRCDHLPFQSVALDVDGTPGFFVDALGPADGYEGFRGEHFSGNAIDNIEEPVLAGLHQDLPLTTVDGQFGKYHVLDVVIVPAVARCSLVVPHLLACGALKGQD